MVSIRQATQQDLFAITSMNRDLGYEGTDEDFSERFQHIDTDDTHEIYVAENEEKIILGWIHVSLYKTLLLKRFAMIVGLVVDKKYRRRGIGSLLLRNAEVWAKERGCFGVRIISGVSRKDQHIFNKKSGYGIIRTQILFKKFFTPL